MQSPEKRFYFQSRDEWRAWLLANHVTQPEAWLALKRKHAAAPGVLYEEAVEEALCFGWIDGAAKGSEENYFYLRFSPRKRRSVWAISNIQRVERLIAEGKMTEAGLATIREAKANGAWQAAFQREDVSTLPEDLSAALAADPRAQAGFAAYPDSQMKQLLHWIASAKTDKTRQKRILETLERATSGKRWGEK